MEKIKLNYITTNGYVEEDYFLKEENAAPLTELNWDRKELTSSANLEYEEKEGFLLIDKESKRIDIAQMSDWPDTKIEWPIRCIGPRWARICTKVPQLFRRMCHKTIYVTLSYPSNWSEEVKNDVLECAKIAAAASVAAALATGPAGAAPVLRHPSRDV